MTPIVPLQEKLISDLAVLTPNQASIRFNGGATEALDLLNEVLRKSLSLTPELRTLLDGFIAQGCDFGAIYARVRKTWPYPYQDWDPSFGPPNLEDAFLGDITAVREMGDSINRRRTMAVTSDSIRDPHINVEPRRIWDLYAHRVVPYHCCIFETGVVSQWWAISHSWTDDMVKVDTPVNGHEWPVPLPKGMTLEAVRTELLNLGAQYVWLDVVCLRQSSSDAIMEMKRKKEWEVDVPAMGTVYLVGAFQVVWYMNGLGRPFEKTGWDGPRHWLNRAWTLQEIKYDSVIGGVPQGMTDPTKERSVDTGELFSKRLHLIGHLQTTLVSGRGIDMEGFMSTIEAMRNRFSTNPVDKIAGVAMLFGAGTIPLYREAMPEEDAWNLCVRHLQPSLIGKLLFSIPAPGDAGVLWRPSWRQLMAKESPRFAHRWSFPQVKEITNDGQAVYTGLWLAGRLTTGKMNSYSNRMEAVLQVKGVHGCEELKVLYSPHVEAAPEADYVLVGDQWAEGWVICLQEGPGGRRLRKVSIVAMGDEEANRVKAMGITTRRWVFA